MSTFFDARQLPQEFEKKIAVASLPDDGLAELIEDEVVNGSGEKMWFEGGFLMLDWVLEGQVFGSGKMRLSKAILGVQIVNTDRDVFYMSTSQAGSISERLRELTTEDKLDSSIYARLVEFVAEEEPSRDPEPLFSGVVDQLKKLEEFYRQAAMKGVGVGITIG